MGEWGWPILGYIVTIGALGSYTLWLNYRLRRVHREVQEID
jgi:hypothetical protein